jgi:hypothetical protein
LHPSQQSVREQIFFAKLWLKLPNTKIVIFHYKHAFLILMSSFKLLPSHYTSLSPAHDCLFVRPGLMHALLNYLIHRHGRDY